LLRALIFDFDGIMVNSEPIIFRLTQEAAAREGWTVSEEEYYRDYLAYDDRGIFEHLYRNHGRPAEPKIIEDLVAWKARTYAAIIEGGLPAMPGAAEFVTRSAETLHLAIASGSLRSEIEYLLGELGLREKFSAIATSDDVEKSKPAPDVYLKALEKLRTLPPLQSPPLQAWECLAIEDAPAGIRAAHAAGMKCLALTNSRPVEDLRHADWVYHAMNDIDLDEIRKAFN
jgi:HAD superfamily hydrolase (TIGR01509 family)